MKVKRSGLNSDNNALSGLTYLALIPLIGLAGAVGVWAYDTYTGSSLFNVDSGLDLENYLWLGALGLGVIFTLVLLFRSRGS